jgi:hypothetical protein
MLHDGRPAPGLDAQGAGRLLFARPDAIQARPGTGSAMFRLGPEELGPRRAMPAPEHVRTTTRNPLFLFRLFGLFLLR